MPKLSLIVPSVALMLSIIWMALALGAVRPVQQQTPLAAQASSTWTYPIDHGGMG